ALLLAALVGDLIFLPALLASRQFGWVFDKKKKGSDDDNLNRHLPTYSSSPATTQTSSSPHPQGHISLANRGSSKPS
ncbi:MAG: hypothetical protein KDB27_27620, partial [Planctomycetales bacterium]|nr:hypothetical protein [Planctomycetales bacterium]